MTIEEIEAMLISEPDKLIKENEKIEKQATNLFDKKFAEKVKI
jgi:hypothetical protein